MSSQNERILNCLRENQGSYVPMPLLANAGKCCAVHSRIADLRRRGHVITNRIDVMNGEKWSWYRLEV